MPRLIHEGQELQRADGHVSISTKAKTGGQISYAGNHQLNNLMTVSRYSEACYASPLGSGQYLKQEVRPSFFDDLLTTDPHIDNRSWASTNCYPYKYAKNRACYKQSGSGQTLFAGPDTPFLSVSVKATYSSDWKIQWVIPTNGEDLCGSNGSFANAALGGGQAIPTGGCGVSPVDNSDINGGSDAELAGDNGQDRQTTIPNC